MNALAKTPRIKHDDDCAADVGLPCRLCQLAQEDPAYSAILTTTPAGKGEPGTELKAITDAMGIPFCERCKGRQAMMNSWGIEGCQANLSTIVEWVRESAKAASWRVTAKAAVGAARMGLMLNPRDPAPGLVAEAIKRAENKAKAARVRIVQPLHCTGLGDALLGMLAIYAYCAVNPSVQVTYGAAPHTLAFTRLFDLPQKLTLGGMGGKLNRARGDIQLGHSRANECRDDPCWSRVEAYCRPLGKLIPVMPRLKEPDRLRALAAEHAGCVVLAPHCAKDTAREWPRSKWVELAKILRSYGRRVVVVDDDSNRVVKFAEFVRALAWPAEQLTGLMLNAACMVGNDSGPAHLAAVVGTPTVVLCGPSEGAKVFSHYPRASYVTGTWECNGCWWQAPYTAAKCLGGCPSLADVSVEQVLTAINSAEVRAKAKIRIVSNYSREYKQLSDITWPSKQKYAEQKGYDWSNRLGVSAPGHGFFWQDRVKFWLEQMHFMPTDAYLWALGCDAAITGSQDIVDLLVNAPDIALSADGYGINSDSMLLRNTAKVQELLASMLVTKLGTDQEILSYLLAGESNYAAFQRKLGHNLRTGGYPASMALLTKLQAMFDCGPLKVSLVPQRLLNAYPSAEYGFSGNEDWAWHPGDLVCHLPGKSLADRLRVLGGVT